MDEGIGIIGLGRMGQALAARLAGQGVRVTGWTRRGVSSEEADALGIAAAAELPSLVAASDIILTSLFDDGAVRDMLTRLAGLDLAGRLIVETSTVSPAIVRDVAPAIEAAGGRLIDAPISGGPDMVAAGTIGLYLGGAEADVARFAPVAARLSSRVVPVGGLGTGHAAKIVNNTAMGGVWQAQIEAFRLGVRLGLTLDTMLGIMERSPATAPAFRDRIPKMTGADTTVGFPVAGVVKDQTLFLSVAAEAGVTLPALEAACENFRATAEAGHAENDLAVVIPVRTAAP